MTIPSVVPPKMATGLQQDFGQASPDSGVPYYVEATQSEISQYLFLFYGGSGSGKTRTAAQFNALGRVLFLSCDTGQMGGLRSGLQFNPLQVRLTSYTHLTGLYDRLERDAKAGVFKTLVLDSLTSLNQLIMRDILAPAFRETARFDDWGLTVARMRSVINKLASFGCHVIFTATEETKKDETIGKLMGLPNIPGKLAVEAPAGVDIVLRFHTRQTFDPTTAKKKVIYLAQTAPDEIWYAKDRSATLAPELVIPETGAFNLFKHLFPPPATEQPNPAA